jgi:hypothetical protein
MGSVTDVSHCTICSMSSDHEDMDLDLDLDLKANDLDLDSDLRSEDLTTTLLYSLTNLYDWNKMTVYWKYVAYILLSS